MIVKDTDAGIEAGRRAGTKTLPVYGAKGADIEISNLIKESLLEFI